MYCGGCHRLSVPFLCQLSELFRVVFRACHLFDTERHELVKLKLILFADLDSIGRSDPQQQPIDSIIQAGSVFAIPVVDQCQCLQLSQRFAWYGVNPFVQVVDVSRPDSQPQLELSLSGVSEFFTSSSTSSSVIPQSSMTLPAARAIMPH